MIVAKELRILNIQMSSDVIELHDLVNLAPGIDTQMRLADDEPIPIAGVAIQKVKVKVEPVNQGGSGLFALAAIFGLTLFYLFAFKAVDECLYSVVLGNHFLVVRLDLDRGSGAENH